MESEVVTAVAQAINTYPDVQALLIDYEGTPAYQNKHQLESSARIVVTPVTVNSAARR